MSYDAARNHIGQRNWPMAGVELLPRSVFASIYRRRAGHDLQLTDEGYWQLDVDGEEWLLPRAHDALRITHIGDEPQKRVVEKYLGDEWEVAPGDRVVDVGAMIGEFARRLPSDDVVCLDPDPRNATCLRVNTDADVLRIAAWCSSGRKPLNVAEETSETSLLATDTNSSEQQTIRTCRVDELLEGPVDLLKVEAEGAEPEVLQGALSLRPTRVAVDVSPERNGQSPAPLCESLLVDAGYSVERDGAVLRGEIK